MDMCLLLIFKANLTNPRLIHAILRPEVSSNQEKKKPHNSLSIFEANIQKQKQNSRQYDPVPSPNTTTGTPTGTPVPPYTGPSISTFLAPLGRADLLSWMTRYWVAQAQPSADFWAHEFSKHATCYSTFDVPCYGPTYAEHAEVADFFATAAAFYRALPTHAWLAAAGIVPSNTTAYALADVQDVLAAAFGAVPYIACAGERFNETAAGQGSSDSGFTALSEVWYCESCFFLFFFLLSPT